MYLLVVVDLFVAHVREEPFKVRALVSVPTLHVRFEVGIRADHPVVQGVHARLQLREKERNCRFVAD